MCISNQNYSGCIDWLLLNEGNNQETSLSLENDSSCLSGRQIRGELRVTFRLDIVHIKRSIGIRSKIHKPVSEVLQPIMARYLPDHPMQEVFLTFRHKIRPEHIDSKYSLDSELFFVPICPVKIMSLTGSKIKL